MKQSGPDKPRLSLIEEQSAEPLRILLVDSLDASSFQIRRAFDGCPTAYLGCAADIQTAAAMVAAEPWDLVAVDPMLADGFAFLKQVKENHRWIATLAVTADHSRQFIRQALHSGVDELVWKPVAAEAFLELALTLAKAMHARRRSEQMRVLAIGAHPDDVEFGCGGTLAKHRANGDLVHILTLSRGAAGGDVNVRTAEAQQAARLLGATLHFGNLRDAHITDGVETISVIEAVIREVRPTCIYTHSWEDTHQDHRAVHAATRVAARSIAKVYGYQTPSSTVDFRPNLFIDITGYLPRKLELVAVHKSQVARSPALQEEFIVSRARQWGGFANYLPAEAMTILRHYDGDMTPDIEATHSVLRSESCASS